MAITSGSDPENRGSNPCAPATSTKNFHQIVRLLCGVGPLLTLQQFADLRFNQVSDMHIHFGGLLGLCLDDGIAYPQVTHMKGHPQNGHVSGP